MNRSDSSLPRVTRALKILGLLSITLSLVAAGCDEEKKDSKEPGQSNANCPDKAPDFEDLTGPCCYRVNNEDKGGSPELRLARLDLTAPSTLATQTVNTTLNIFLTDETFNWLVRLDGLDGNNPTYTTGFGERNDDNTFSFRNASDTFAPISGSGDFTDENFTSSAADTTVIIPITDAETGEVTVQFNVTSLRIEKAQLSENRSCIGTRGEKQYDSSQGQLSGFIEVEAAKSAVVEVIPGNETSLCLLVAGETVAFTPETNCTSAQEDWFNPPDALCDENGVCEADPGDGSLCTPADCNAWALRAEFAAHGVEITDERVGGASDGGVDAQ